MAVFNRSSPIRAQTPVIFLFALIVYWGLFRRPAFIPFGTRKQDVKSSIASSPPANLHSLDAALRPDELHTLPLLNSLATFSLIPAHSNLYQAKITNTTEALDSFFKSRTDLVLFGSASNEEEYVIEWITHHRLLGVTKIVLFDFDRRVRKDGLTLKEILLPWRMEGSVMLVEVDWQAGKVSDDWQRTILTFAENEILPRVAWAAHWDSDEFLLPPIPSMSSGLPPHPVPVGAVGSSFPREDVTLNTGWSFPLLERLTMLSEAVCVPVWISIFVNAGVEDLNAVAKGDEWETVVAAHTYRKHEDSSDANYGFRWGKVFLHPAYDWGSVEYGGMHNCVPGDEDLKILHPVTGADLPDYSGTGKPDLTKGMALMHYQQRSLENCYEKLDRLNGRKNWRTHSGKNGCSSAMLTPTQVQHGLDVKDLEKDVRMKESWQARATRALIREWRRDGKWAWQGRKESGVNVVGIVL